MPLEVIGAGWGRTGTLSLAAALESLGYPCYHMVEVLPCGHSATWLKLVQTGEAPDWEQLFAGFRATVDWPACSFYQQLMAAYPQAKVILGVRDPEKWYRSAKATIYSMVDHWVPFYVDLLLPLAWRQQKQMVQQLLWQRDLQGCFGSDPQRAQRLFSEHIEEVKRTVPGDRLLVFDLAMGWEPLCQFLGLPVPDVPFPHVNTTDEFRAWSSRVRWTVRLLKYGVPVVAAGVAAVAAVVVRRVLGRSR